MPEPAIPQKSPYGVDVKAGESYWWCACGKSAGQPFCDGSHRGTNFTPIEYTASDDTTVFFCGCKHSAQKPLCDGSHNSL